MPRAVSPGGAGPGGPGGVVCSPVCGKEQGGQGRGVGCSWRGPRAGRCSEDAAGGPSPSRWSLALTAEARRRPCAHPCAPDVPGLLPVRMSSLLFLVQKTFSFITYKAFRWFPVLVIHSTSLFALQALGSFYFLHESLKNIYQFDFKGKTLLGSLLGSPRPVAPWEARSH